MEIALNSRARRITWLGAAFLLSGTFLTASTLHFLAAFVSRAGVHLNIAARLEPTNAKYHELLGRQLLRQDSDIRGALHQYQIAASLNPYNSGNWLEIADAQQLLDNTPGQRYALEHALATDPTTPHAAWTAASFFLAQGDRTAALREFKVVLESDPGLADNIFAIASRTADVTEIIQKLLPSSPGAYLSFLNFMIVQKNATGAARAWDALVGLGKSFEPAGALAYVDYLIAHREVTAARLAWRQTAALCSLSAYLPSGENLIANANFDSDILNRGFDWRYWRQANVDVSLDPAEFHDGHRSLSVVFDGPGVEEAGISQLVPVEPNTAYQFSAYYKAAAMDGAGGARIDIQDAYTGTHYFSSDDLRNSEVWHEISGAFQVDEDTQLVLLRVLRVPAGSPIRGKLWLNDFLLTEKETGF
jgi:tetratricopeptide (TPR) repeat protein